MEVIPKKRLKASSCAQCRKSYTSKFQTELLQQLNLDRNSTISFCDVKVRKESCDFFAHKCILWASGCFQSVSALEYVISNFLNFDKMLTEAFLCVVDAIYGSKICACDSQKIRCNLSQLKPYLNILILDEFLSPDVHSIYEPDCKFDRMVQCLNKERFSSGSDVLLDATINCDSEQFLVHKCIVGTASNFFKTLFTTKLISVDSSNFTVKYVKSCILKEILDFIYLSEITLTEENVYDMVSCSDYLMLLKLKNFCCDFLCICINNENFFNIYNCAETFCLEIVSREVAEYFYSHLWEITEKKLFKSFSIDTVIKFLKMKCNRRCDEAVFAAILQWLMHEIHERQSYVSILGQTVNQKKISLPFLKDVLPSLLYSDPTCSSLIKHLEQQTDATVAQCIYFVNFSCSNKFFFDVSVVMKYDFLLDQWLYVGSCEPPDYDESNADFEECEAVTTSVFLGTSFYIIGILGKRVFKLCFAVNQLKWEEVASLLEFRSNSAAAVFSGKIYVTGGLDFGQEPMNSCECYDFESDSWHLITPMSSGRGVHNMVASCHCLYVIGGVAAHAYDKSIDSFNMQTEDWQYISSNDDFADDATLITVLFKNDIFIVNYSDDEANAPCVMLRYNVATKAWSNVVVSCEICQVHSLIPGDKLYAIVRDYKKQICLYDYEPSTTTWNLVSLFASVSSSLSSLANAPATFFSVAV